MHLPETALRRLTLDTPMIAGDLFAAMLGRIRGPVAAELPSFKEARQMLKPTIKRDGDVAIVPVKGVLARNPDIWELAFMGYEDMDAVSEMLDQVSADASVKAVVLDIDSPGGFVNGTPEIGDAVAALNARKPVVAFTAGMACSAAYWIASQAGAVVASRSAIVGSIGVYAALYDLSAYYAEMGVKVEVMTNAEGTFKGAGVPGVPLTQEQRDNFQSRIQRDFNEFRAAVVAKRPAVSADTMRGQTFNGAESVALGLTDAVGNQQLAIQLARFKARQGNNQPQ